MNPVPKPQKRPPKPRQPLRRKRPGVRRRVAGPRPSDALAHPKPRREAKTSHGRRLRETGRMLFYKSMPCMLVDGMAMLRTVSTAQARVWVDFCDGPTEAAHLGPRAGFRRCPDNQTAPLCRKHHRQPGIDGNVGGRAKWYVAMNRSDQLRLRQVLWTQADLLWLALPDHVREEWGKAGHPQEADGRAEEAGDGAPHARVGLGGRVLVRRQTPPTRRMPADGLLPGPSRAARGPARAGEGARTMTYDEFVAHMSPLCKCCNECSQVVCGGVMAGGFCDRICYGHDEDGEDYCEDDIEDTDDVRRMVGYGQSAASLRKNKGET